MEEDASASRPTCPRKVGTYCSPVKNGSEFDSRRGLLRFDTLCRRDSNERTRVVCETAQGFVETH